MRLCCWLLVVAVPPLMAHGEELGEGGLYALWVKTGEAQYLGDYHDPSVDAQNRYLYADQGGTIVRWSLDDLTAEPAVFAAPEGDEPGYRFAMAAPRGGMVAGIRHFPVRRPGRRYFRACLDILNTDGRRIRGPLPLFRAPRDYDRARSVVWHPNGDKIAFALTEGEARPGIYVFEPATKNWILVDEFRRGSERRPLLRWQPNGRSLSHIDGGNLWLRAGGHYAAYRSMPTKVRRHAWLDYETLALLDPRKGLLLRKIDGSDAGVMPGWGGGPPTIRADLDSSLPVAGPHGIAWVTPAAEDDGSLQVSYLPALDRDQRPQAIATFRRGKVPYIMLESGPVWHPVEPILFVVVPRGDAGSERHP